MTEAPERQPAAWRYRYQGGKWTVQKNKPAWWTPDSVAELEPLFPAPYADKVQALVEALQSAQESIATFMGVHGYPKDSGAGMVLGEVSAALVLEREQNKPET